MNRFYRVVFNRSLSVWQAVPETAKAQGKGGKSVKAVAVALLSLGAAQMAVAATNFTWSGDAPDNYWETGTNWVGGTAPGPNDWILISSPDSQVNQLVINTDGTLSNSLSMKQTDNGPVDITLSAGTGISAILDGAFSIAAGSTLRIGSAGHDGMLTLGAGEGRTPSNITLSVEHGTLRPSGSIIRQWTNGPGSTLNVGADGIYDLNGGADGSSVNTQGLTGSGHIRNDGAEDALLDVVGNNTFDGVIQDGDKKTRLSTSGHLTLTGANTNTGGSVIRNGGTLQIGNGGTTGAITGDVVGDGTLAFNRSNNYLFGGNISGSNSLVQAGAGKTILTGDNTYTGGTTVSGGTLVAGSRTALGTGSIELLQDGAELVLDADGAVLSNWLYMGQTDGGPVDVTLSAGTGINASLDGQLSITDGSTLRIGSEGHNGTLSLLTLLAVEGGASHNFTLSVEHGTFRPGGFDAAGLTSTTGSTLNVGADGIYDLNGGVWGSNVITQGLTGSGRIRNDGSDDARLDVLGNSTFDGVIEDRDKKTGLSTSGHLTLTGANTYTGGSSISNGGTLQIGNGGTTGAITGDVVGDGTLAFNRSNDYLFGGNVSGSNALVQAGMGKTTLTGVNTYTGGTTVTAGTLQIDGSLVNSDVAVQRGATLIANGILGGAVDVWATGRLQGAGTVGDTVVSGTVAPGSAAIGTLNVAGNIVFNPGSAYQVKVDASGTSDRIQAAGTSTLNGGTVQVLAGAGHYASSTSYTILTAQGGRTGTFDNVSSNLAFLTPTLDYDANNVHLTMTRNKQDFAGVGQTPNQMAVGRNVESLSAGNAIYDATLSLSAEQARPAFDALSGEIHASVRTALLEDSRFVRNAANDSLRAAQTATARLGGGLTAPVSGNGHSGNSHTFWSQAYGSWGSTNSDGNAGRLSRDSHGLLMGVDTNLGDWRAGVLTGYGDTRAKASGRNSSASSRNFHLGVYGGKEWGSLALRTGTAYSWHSIKADRSVAIPGFSDSLKDKYRAGTWQAFAELGYGIQTAENTRIEPFANLAHVRLRTNGYTEQGGAAALSGGSANTNVTFTTLGLRAEHQAKVGSTEITLSGLLGWRRAFGDTTPTATHGFQGAGSAFTVAGAPIAKNSALVEAGVSVKLSPVANLGLAYTGQLASSARDHGVRANLTVRF